MSSEEATFSFNDEKLIGDDVKFMSWCPTYDLFLLVSPTNTISLYRSGLTIVKVWTLQHKALSAINTVAWKPNGREFVLGCSDGIVYKVDINYHTPAIVPCWITPSVAGQSTVPVLSVAWINYEYKKKLLDIDDFESDAFDLEAALPRLSQEPPEVPLSRISAARPKKTPLPVKPLEENEKQTLLFTSDAEGQVNVILNGIYPIASFRLAEKLKLEATEIQPAQNASLLQILAKSRSNTEFISFTLDTQILNDRKEEIHSVSEIQTQLNYLLQYTKSTVDIVKQHHDSFSGSIQSVARQAATFITNHNEDTTAMPEVELFGTLATGNVTESLQEFFTENLTSQRIKLLEANVKFGYHNSLVVICEHILPACERIQLQLCKLLGYSLWTQRYGDFLNTEAVEDCIEKARKIVSEAFKYSKAIGALIKSFDAFCQWITIVSQKIYDPDSTEFEHQSTLCENPDLVADFLENDFVRDSVDVYFSQKEKNLVFLTEDLSKSCVEMLKRPSETLSAKMHVSYVTTNRLNAVSIPAQPRLKMVSITGFEQDGIQTMFYAMLQLKPEPQLIVLKKRFNNDLLKYAAYNVNGRITDLEFFDEKELGILVQVDRETTILQAIPLAEIKFQSLNGSKQVISKLPNTRSQKLERMIDVRLGCNGLPRRRVLSVAASNGMLKTYFMDKSEEQDDSDEDE